MRGVFAFLFVFVFIGAADAVQSCLALQTLTECGASVAEGPGYVDWSAECAGLYTIRGIAGCSVYQDSYARADIDFGQDFDQEVFCFCKVYAPFESGWQYATGSEKATDCRENCAYYCAEGFVSGETKEIGSFRENIIGSVK